MKKRGIALMLIFSIVCSPYTIFANEAGLDNFEKTASYHAGIFNDVSGSDWYSKSVASAYEYGLMGGKGDKKFDPKGNFTIAEAVTVASKIHSTYYNGEVYPAVLEDGDAWYIGYVNYAREEGILEGQYSNYNRAITRAEFAKLFAASIDKLDFEEINVVDDGAIPDVGMNSNYSDAVYMLYRAGILAGSGDNGAFYPDSNIIRAEAAAIIARIIDADLRVSVSLSGEY